MKIAIVPFHSGLANDILFDKDNESTNSDDLITPYYYIKQEYEKRGVSINTLDQYNTLDSLDCVLFFKLDYNELIRCIKSKVKYGSEVEDAYVNLRKANEGWEQLGSYYFDSDTVRVVLTDECKLRSVTADAVKIVKRY